MVVGATILVYDRGLRIVAHNGGAHDVARTAIDHRIGCIGLHHAISCTKLIKNKSVNVYDGLEAISYVVVVVQTILDHRFWDAETVVIWRKSDAIGFHRKLLASAIEGDLSRRMVSQLLTQGRSKVTPVFYEIQDRAIGILIPGRILRRNKIAAG